MAENKPEYIFVHCTDSEWGTAAAVTDWHMSPKPRGNGWSRPGYHYLIYNGRISAHQAGTLPSSNYDARFDGYINQLQGESSPGIHAPPFNQRSIAICMVGKTKFTDRQRVALLGLVAAVRRRYNISIDHVLGHYESPNAGGKTCPNIDMTLFRAELERVQSEMRLGW